MTPDYCSLWPEFIAGIYIGACCQAHDEAFDAGGGLWAFLTSNIDLGACIAALSDHPVLLASAIAMVGGTTLFGLPFWIRAAWRRRSASPSPTIQPASSGLFHARSTAMNRKAFYDTVRPTIGALTQGQVAGFERYFDEAARRATPLDWLAYILATVFWETARTMQPVKEAYWKNEAWRKANLRYFPWYGRGDVQLTWEANYLKAGNAIGVDLIANPDAALDPVNSVRITFEGMEHGWFTGKALDTYLDGIDEYDKEDLREFANARRIVNGTDKQIEIGKLALTFEKGLRAADYSHASASDLAVEPAPAPQPVEDAIVIETRPANPSPTPVEQASKAVGAGKWTAIVGASWAAISAFLLATPAVPEIYRDPVLLAGIGTLLTTLASIVGAYFAPANATPGPAR